MLFAAKRPFVSLLSKYRLSLIRCLRSGSEHSLGVIKPVRSITHTPSSKPRYTPEEDEKIVRGYNDGRTWEEIASDMNRSPSGIKARFSVHLSASSPSETAAPWNAVDDKLLLDYRRRGELFRAIAIKLNRPYNSIHSRYCAIVPTHARHTSKSRKLYTPSEDLALLRLRDKEHKSFQTIGRLLGRPWSSIRCRYRYLSDPQVISGNHPSDLRIKYTPLDDAKIVRMKELEDASFHEIAGQLARTTRSIIGRYYIYLRNERDTRPKGPKGKVVFWTDVEDRRLMELRIAGSSWQQISAELSPRSHSAVRVRHELLMERQSRTAGPIRDTSSLVCDSTL